ncbi:MAG: YlxM family DNA-binding protein [Clostridiales bacterium]|nr:YlxM family DNA-binding protein [Clostridiales bacterium]
MEKNVRMALLFDFFGELLTQKQRGYFQMYYDENLSLSEIAENEGITRQAVRDIIMRTENILEETEARTGIVKRFTEIQADISVIEGYLDEIAKLNKSRFKNGALLDLCNRISERLQFLKY